MVAVGNYYRTGGGLPSDRVKAYTLPPLPGAPGQYICTLGNGITIGPVERVFESRVYISVLVRGYWMNLAKIGRDGTQYWFAMKVHDQEVQQWKANGWREDL